MPNDRGQGRERFQEQVRSLREVQLVRAACGVLLRRGCGDVRVDEVAAACGVAKGTCYQHFRTRPDLIAAAVARLDEALAGRLSSPPPRLTKPRQVLEWALLEALEAKLLILAQHDGGEELKAEHVEGKTWPCCLRFLPCPYGYARKSIAALRRSAADLVSHDSARAHLCMILVLALPLQRFLALGDHGESIDPRALRATARELFKLLLP